MKHWIVPILAAVLLCATAQADNTSNQGQVVSECNHRANERNLKGQDRKDFTEWCESRGGRYGYDDNRYNRERDCYRNADKSGLTGDKRQKFLGNCFDEGDRAKVEDKGKQYHPKVSDAVENSQHN
jgi:hypothetical protein